MEEFRVAVRIRNNLLLQRREELGLSQAELARRIGQALPCYCALETMRESPKTKAGAWRKIALALAKFYKTLPEDLWPDPVLGIKATTAERRVGAAALAQHGFAALAPARDPENTLDLRETIGVVEQAMQELPEKQRAAVALRFDGARMCEIADALDTSRSNAAELVRVGAMKIRRRLILAGVIDRPDTDLRQRDV